MEELIKKLKASLVELEKLDDSTGTYEYRERLDDAHYSLSECIDTLGELKGA